jgi:hypothetical protein
VEGCSKYDSGPSGSAGNSRSQVISWLPDWLASSFTALLLSSSYFLTSSVEGRKSLD